ncbi:putative hemolysin [Enterobacter cancerogenus]|uniref:putative hemolysin n=1 Tax=Enterobacter cancerogenus TaxID=69218 RepID=UPI004058C38A
MKKKLIFLSLIMVSACHSDQSINKKQPTGMGNPASGYCEQLGGRVSFSNSYKGVIGYCLLPDGELVEEWALYNESHTDHSHVKK